MLLDGLTATTFRTLSRLRGGRIFHPTGAAFSATWEPASDGPLPGNANLARGDHAALVRLSRALGLPETWPDILGVAVKVLDVHGPGRDQDLLLASVGHGAVGTRLLIPQRRFAGTTFSTILPYHLGGRRTPLLAEAHGPEPSSYAALERAAAAALHLRIHDVAGREVARVRLAERCPSHLARDLRFDPWHSGKSLQPVGALNRLRRPAYVASQQGRGAPGT